MEILVDKGKLDYIVLYEGDNMALKISHFISKHRLQPLQAMNLKKIVALKVDKFNSSKQVN